MMKYFTIFLALAAPMLSTAAPAAEPVADVTPAPISILEERACHFNAANIGTWQEFGLTRRRTHSSSNPENLNNNFRDSFRGRAIANAGSNVQAWNDAGGWFIDSSWVLGAGGDDAYFRTLNGARSEIIQRYGCSTG